ncbi:MAG: malate synthase [Candidatus Tokpelaia sp. JSC188]|nr:MAG: malate synthase [Candidatus Tokpelaia sp. JSC188]
MSDIYTKQETLQIKKEFTSPDIYLERETLKVRSSLANFIETEVLQGLDIKAEQFWQSFSTLVAKHMDTNRALLQERAYLQQKIDLWHKSNGPIVAKPEIYCNFLREIGYLVAEAKDFTISTEKLDPEITKISGPQLVVPISNARYALNATNARWGSLYDALYGTDAISQKDAPKLAGEYNPIRGEAVFDYVAMFMDKIFPLQKGHYTDVTAYEIKENKQKVNLIITVKNTKTHLQDSMAFRGFREEDGVLYILLEHNKLHVELVVDRSNPIGNLHPAGLADIIVESAITVIQDCEDSVVAVDAQDKVAVYRNWLGLMKTNLQETFEKNGRKLVRLLNPDRQYISTDGKPFSVKGRALMMVRNVGHLMMTDAVLDTKGMAIGEGLMDGIITTLCAMHDLKQQKNSKTGSIYIVKPKMHGPKEVAFAAAIFTDIEEMLGLIPNTIKIGIMDEERRTSANLKAVIKEVVERIFFINTGFLDRTGDEIHTVMMAGPVLPKEKIKAERWLAAYEDRNVIIGLQCGLMGRAQIGKGMWTQPDSMYDMLEQKISHPQAGANCAWVPSPTAATLHALHYHYVDVQQMQERRLNEASPPLSVLFSMPMLEPAHLTVGKICNELDNNAQGILGYVVRWVDQGIGCSKVPDIHNISLMEDRATCRISSQVIANWLKHGIVSEIEVLNSFKRMAIIVDDQNVNDPLYQPMATNIEDSIAFQAALALALKGNTAPSGYTEPILHVARCKMKSSVNKLL